MEDSWQTWLSHLGIMKDEEGLMKKSEIGTERKGRKKGRSSSEALYHIMSERKRRQDIAEKFVALSAIIPGLKKIDKAYVLEEAIKYVRELEQRIAVLEKGTNKNSRKSLMIAKSRICVAPCEIEARGLEKQVLIRIHCKKRKGIMLKLFALLNDLHLSIATSTVFSFGNSILNIIIIAQMGEKYNLTVNDLVKTLKQDLLKLYDMQCDRVASFY